MENKLHVVFYHTTAPNLVHAIPPDTYEKICKWFVKQCHEWRFDVTHLTCSRDEKYTDDAIVMKGEPKDIVKNREYAFVEFLEVFAKEKQVYLFTEPDLKFLAYFPDLPPTCDIALLYRHKDTPHISPAWRLCRKSALPFFQMIESEIIHTVNPDWHGDSIALNEIWKKMERKANLPREYFEFGGLHYQFRSFEDYIKSRCRYSYHYTANNKNRLLAEIEGTT